MGYTIDERPKTEAEQHRLIMFSCLVSVLVSQTRSLKPSYWSLRTPT